MMLIHFQGNHSAKTACGRIWKMKSQRTESPGQVTCPKCKKVLGTQRETTGETMKITLKDLKRVINEAGKKTNAQKSAAYQSRIVNKMQGGKFKPTTPASKLKSITDALKKLGLVVASREQSPGATKAWMKRSMGGRNIPIKASELVSALRDAGIDCKVTEPAYYRDPGVTGTGFMIEIQTDDDRGDTSEGGGKASMIYIGVYKGGRRGEEEQMGIDTADLGEADDPGDTGGMYVNENETDRLVDEVLDELNKKVNFMEASRFGRSSHVGGGKAAGRFNWQHSEQPIDAYQVEMRFPTAWDALDADEKTKEFSVGADGTLYMAKGWVWDGNEWSWDAARAKTNG